MSVVIRIMYIMMRYSHHDSPRGKKKKKLRVRETEDHPQCRTEVWHRASEEQLALLLYYLREYTSHTATL